MNDTNFKYELFFELSPDLLCIAGYDGYFKKINHAVANTLGYSFEELYARPINDFVYHDDKDLTSKVRHELTQSKPLYNFENRYLNKNGEIIWLSWTSLPVDSEKLVFAIAKNITHKKRIEAERNSLLANLTKVNNELKQLNYTTSHDLRSPVTSLLSIFDMLDVTRITDQETIELIDILKLAGEQLKQTLNNYVDVLSEKHSAHANLEEVDLNECLNSVVKSISSLIQTSKITINTDFSEVNKIKFNKSYMESVFLNLITNSIKYTKPNDLPIVSIHTESVGKTIRLIFEDNGLGFDMEKVKDKIFGLRQTFHDHKDSKGIGLYLVYNHITSLGGKIDVESKINEGTRFIITIKK